jgi:hypothetical protein
MKTEPKTRYKMLWCGAWRPVTDMFDGPNRSNNPFRCTAAVLWIPPGKYEAVPVTGGDIVESGELSTQRKWEPI